MSNLYCKYYKHITEEILVNRRSLEYNEYDLKENNLSNGL